MGIIKRKNGYYYYYLYTQTPKGKKRISLETKDERLAHEIYQASLLDKIKQKLDPYNSYSVPVPEESSLQSPNRRKSPLISNLYKQYLESVQNKGICISVYQAKERLAKLLKKQHLIRISDITPQNITKLLKSLSKIGTYTAEMHIRNLKAFLNFLIKKGQFLRSDYEMLSFPAKRQAVRDTVISEKDYQKLLKETADRDFVLYLQTLWETGCRPNEIVPLKKCEIDFNKGLARIFQTKTKKYKIIYFTDELISLFESLPDGTIFKGAEQGKEYYSKKFKTIKERLNLPKEYCLYAFRHSFATRMLNKTKDLHLVSKLLGHSDISITAKRYINGNPEEICARLIETK